MFNFPSIQNNHKDILKSFYGIFPVPIEKIAEVLGYEILYFSPNIKTLSISGFVNYNKKEIGINNSDSDYKQRFTIAHELGHILNGDNKDDKFHIDYRKNIEGKSGDNKETLANKIAAELLMPKIAFIDEFNRLKKLGKSNISIFMRLSLYFEASEMAIEFRAKNLRLV